MSSTEVARGTWVTPCPDPNAHESQPPAVEVSGVAALDRVRYGIRNNVHDVNVTARDRQALAWNRGLLRALEVVEEVSEDAAPSRPVEREEDRNG